MCVVICWYGSGSEQYCWVEKLDIKSYDFSSLSLQVTIVSRVISNLISILDDF